jgi:hypothetical protein
MIECGILFNLKKSAGRGILVQAIGFILHYPKKISCSRFLAQDIDYTALPKNTRLTKLSNYYCNEEDG